MQLVLIITFLYIEKLRNLFIDALYVRHQQKVARSRRGGGGGGALLTPVTANTNVLNIKIYYRE